MITHHHRTSGAPCPVCKKTLDSACSPYTPEPPGAGDASICWHCGSLLIFGDDLLLRIPTGKEMKELAKIPELKPMLEGIVGAREGSLQ